MLQSSHRVPAYNRFASHLCLNIILKVTLLRREAGTGIGLPVATPLVTTLLAETRTRIGFAESLFVCVRFDRFLLGSSLGGGELLVLFGAEARVGIGLLDGLLLVFDEVARVVVRELEGFGDFRVLERRMEYTSFILPG